MTYDTSGIDNMDDTNSFSQKYIALFLTDLKTLIPSLQNILSTKNSNALFQAIHKIKPTVHILKINFIKEEVDYINANKEFTWNDELQSKTIKIIAHLKEVRNEMTIALS